MLSIVGNNTNYNLLLTILILLIICKRSDPFRLKSTAHAVYIYMYGRRRTSITSHWKHILEIFPLARIEPVSQGIWHPLAVFPRDYGIPLVNLAPPEVAGNMASPSLYYLGNIARGWGDAKNWRSEIHGTPRLELGTSG